MQLVDIGANLTADAFSKDLNNVITRGFDAGVSKMVLTGSSLKDSQEAATLAARYPKQFWSTAGIHPHMAESYDLDSKITLRGLAELPQVCAIGESGLDFNRDFSPRNAQRNSFAAHLELASELKLPLFLHQRDAHEDFMEIMKSHRQSFDNAIVHCFTGDEKELDDYLAMDLHIGITGWICDERRGHHLREFIGKIPADRLMIETDAPYLLPRDIRPKPKSRRNEPMYLPHICQVIADVRGVDAAELAKTTTQTAERFFGI
jgi:TatD DNase family protein